MATLVFPEEMDLYKWLQNIEYPYDERHFIERKMKLVEHRLLAALFQSKLSLKSKRPGVQFVKKESGNRNSSANCWSGSDSEDDANNVVFVPRGILRPRYRKSRPTTSVSASRPKRSEKHVRFADAVGQKLESVQHIVYWELPPAVPGTALDHLRKPTVRVHRQLHPLFQLSEEGDLAEKVRRQGVVLEQVQTLDTSVQGTVRVLNLAYQKVVSIRYTLNEWETYTDVEANYVSDSSDGETDKFSFRVFVSCADERFVPGCKVHFAVRYLANGEERWDNNEGSNYTLECYATSVPVTLNQSWVHFS